MYLDREEEVFYISGVKISAVNLYGACHLIRQWIENNIKTYVCVVPASTIVECQKDKRYLNIINNAGMATPDGMPIVWLGRLKSNKTVERTYGPDLLLAISTMSEAKRYRHYFCGGTPKACELLKSRLTEKFPYLNIVGFSCPSFDGISKLEADTIITDINKANPDILWVGLGSPKQDFWMYENRPKLDVPVMVGVGAAFDFISGVKKQAPRWMQKIGLEWFFRLCCEPKRLWRRYLIGNTKFLFYVLRDCLRNGFIPRTLPGKRQQVKIVRFPKQEHMNYPPDGVTSPRLYYSRIFGRFYRHKLKILCDYLPRNNITKILEIGFGSGIALKELSSRSKEVYAIDIHNELDLTRDMLKKEGITNAYVFKHDIFQLPFTATTEFDFVVSSSVFEHIRKEDLEKGMIHVYRCLKDEGYFLLGFPLKTRAMNTLFKIYETTYQRMKKDIQRFSHIHHHPSGQDEIIPILLRYFTIEEKTYFINSTIKLYVALKCRKKNPKQVPC